MDIPALYSNKRDDNSDRPTTTDGDHVRFGTSGGDNSQLDPLAGLSLDDLMNKKPDEAQEELVKNDTISTNDDSSVGDFKKIINRPDPEPVIPNVAPAPEVIQPAEQTTNNEDFQIIDPDKMDFIKTYTKSFDDLVVRATSVVEQVLSAIDKTVKDHSEDIDIPAEADEFLGEAKPAEHKVQRFEDAQQIVRTIMNKAEEAKKQSEQAAKEASDIYDGIQQFKRDTEDQIASIKKRDEFGHVMDDTTTPGSMSTSTYNKTI